MAFMLVVSLLLGACLDAEAETSAPRQARNESGWYDVTSYGAKGDGIADDYTAIAAAAGAIPRSGGILYFPPGSYRIGATVVLRSGIGVRGAGIGVSKIQQADGANLSSLVSYAASSAVTVSDVTFDGNKDRNAARTEGLLKFDNSSDIVVRNSEFKNAVGHSTVGSALSFAGVNRRILIDGNYVHDAGVAGSTPADGIYVGGYSIRVVNNLVVGASDTGIVYEAVSGSPAAPSDHGLIANNIVRDTPQGIAVDAAIAGSYGATASVMGNTIEGVTAVNGASIFIFRSARGKSQVAVAVVGNVIRNSADGHGILLDSVSEVTVSGNIVSGVSLQKAKHGITILKSSLVSVVGNAIRGVGSHGLSLQGVTDVTVTGNVVTEANAAGRGGVGIDVRDAPGSRTDSVVIVGNTVSGTKQNHSLQIADASGNLIVSGNSFRDGASSVNNATVGSVAFGLNLAQGGSASDPSRGPLTSPTAWMSSQWRPAHIPDGGVATTTVSAAGAAVGDAVICSFDQLRGLPLVLSCHVQSAGSIRAVLLNRGGGPVEIPIGTLRVGIFRPNAP